MGRDYVTDSPHPSVEVFDRKVLRQTAAMSEPAVSPGCFEATFQQINGSLFLKKKLSGNTRAILLLNLRATGSCG